MGVVEAGADFTDRRVDLWDDDQYGQADGEGEITRERRNPMPTATNATDRVAKNSNTKLERNAIFSTLNVELACWEDSRVT